MFIFKNSVDGIINKVIWPSTDTNTTSLPICIGAKKEPIFRKCANGVWEPEPKCLEIQPEKPPRCPTGFFQNDSICYMLTEKTYFPPKCPFGNPLPFDSYKHLINEPVWMPVQRTNSLEFLVWIEPSPLYKKNFDRTYFYQNGIKNKNCLVYYNNSYIEAMSCFETFSGLCAYKTFNFLMNQLCPSEYNICVPSHYSTNSSCLCVGSNLKSRPRADFLEFFQNSFVETLKNQTCGIGLVRNDDGEYVWHNAKKEIEYTYWSPNCNFNADYNYGALSPNGWILTSEPVACSIFETKIDNLTPSIEMTYNSAKFNFVVKLVNPLGLKELDKGVWTKCFTDTTEAELTYQISSLTPINILDDFHLYTFQEQTDGVGSYWCEVVTYLTSQTIRSVINTSSLKESNDYVVILKIKYESINPLSKDLIEYSQKVFCVEFYKQFASMTCSCRFMKIVDLDETQETATINFHVTYHKDYQLEEEVNIKVAIDDTLRKLNSNISIKLEDFLHGSFCFSGFFHNLTWPKTYIGVRAKSAEFCFNKYSDLVTSRCVGNFLDGGVWEPVDDCKIAGASNMTGFLATMLDDLSEENLFTLSKVSETPSQFNALDVFIFGKFLIDMIQSSSIMYSSIFLELINNLMASNTSVLEYSQREMNGTSILLLVYQNTITYEALIKNKTNFLILPITEMNFCGYAFQRSFYTKIECGFDIDKILDLENLDYAIFLENELPNDTPFANLGIFFNDALFVDDNSRTDSPVFTLGIPGFIENTSKIIINILYNDFRENTNKKQCGFWNFENSHWINEELSRFKNSIKCSFVYDSTSAYTLTHKFEPFNNDTNDVTEDLIAILESNSTVPKIIDKLLNVSKRFIEFEPVDVHFVGKILEKVNRDEEIDLRKFAKIISNIQKIDTKVLSKSQLKHQSTDYVIQQTDIILQNHKFENILEMTENFIILIHKSTNFTGVLILKDHGKFHLKILEEEFDPSNYTNLDSAMILSSNLRNQLQSKIIVTVFYEDVMFPEKNQAKKVVNQIFGVILPKVEFSGPLMIYHKVDSTENQRQCAYWYFNSSSFWKNDDRAQQYQDLLKCDYWHTTHFALLLLDQDKYEDNDKILEKITIVCCVFSFGGLLIVILTAVLFKKWRSETSNQILLNYVFLLIVKLSMFYVSNIDLEFKICTIMGLVLHYCVLSDFFWMLIIAFLQYNRLVVVFRVHNNILVKTMVFGWILPSIPVLILFLVDKNSYVEGKVGLCYPSGWGLYFGVWLPVSVVLFVNMLFFAKIMYNVICQKSNIVSESKCDKKYQIRLGFFLFFMLGLTWIFGFLAELSFGVVFAVLFNLTGSLQGYIVFLFFVAFNKDTRGMYVKSLKNLCGKIE